jgi:hypothetical protein
MLAQDANLKKGNSMSLGYKAMTKQEIDEQFEAKRREVNFYQ